MILLNNINLLQTYWGFSSGGDRYLDFSKLYLLPAFYSVFEATLIMFSILFMAQNILKTNVSLYVLVFAIQLIEIIFGGIFTQFFLWTVDLTSDEGHAYAIPYYHALAFPDSSYWFASVINPLFAPSMHMQAFSSKWEYKCSTGMSSYGAGHEFNFWIWETTSNTFGSLSRIEIYKWNSLWISPYIWTGSFAGLGILVSSLKK